MSMKSSGLGYWRSYFRSAKSDIFDVIENAIAVAASDCPKEFRSRRDRIAQKLFASRLTKCCGCDHVEVLIPEDCGRDENQEKDGFENGSAEIEEIKTDCDANDRVRADSNPSSHYSYDEAEALTEEIEEESQTIEEVVRIKGILANYKEESDGVLFECLRRLQLMGLSVEHLQATEIGKAVKCLRKHSSKQVQLLAWDLVEGWMQMVDEFIRATATVASQEGTPDSLNPSIVEDEEGLPSPPLDEAFLATQTATMELSQFFDGMDDDGNPRNSGRTDKDNENKRKSSVEGHPPMRKPLPVNDTSSAKEKNPNRKQEDINRHSKPSICGSGPGRTLKTSSEHKANGVAKPQQQKDRVEIQKKQPNISRQDNRKGFNEITDLKLEAAKRKLHERYQEHEKAKKQRTIQVMELHDLPKQGLGNRNIHVKYKSSIRNRPTMWRQF